MDPKPGRRVPSAWRSGQAGDFSYSVAMPAAANPDNLPVNDERIAHLATLHSLMFRCPACARLRSISLDVPDHAGPGRVVWQ